MVERFLRTGALIGEDAMNKLKNSRVAVFGAGGVGGYCLEALARTGIGAIDVIDNDTVAESNINRQIYALSSTVGRYKVDVAEERIKDINPDCKVITHKLFYLPETADEINLSEFDYIVDAIDTVAAKLCLIERAEKAGVPVISALVSLLQDINRVALPLNPKSKIFRFVYRCFQKKILASGQFGMPLPKMAVSPN